ncbi:MAG: N-acetylglucosamine-6-phosphate deacetylase [Vicinamibacterales bacterium]
MAEIVLAGADLVLPDRILTAGTLVVDEGRIMEIRAVAREEAGADLRGHLIVPGFVDAHVHGTGGFDSLGDGDAVRAMAAHLPGHGVTGFSPTSMSCAPAALSRFLAQVRRAREAPAPRSARVLPAHVEGPFLHPDLRGAQHPQWLRSPRRALDGWRDGVNGESGMPLSRDDGADTLRALETGLPDVGTVTLAPEIEGGLDLLDWLVQREIRVSVGHSAASYDEAIAAFTAGASGATHLFNCMPPLRHRDPGVAGAVLRSDGVVAEVIADGVHVHPAVVRLAIAAKGPAAVMAVTDGTALSGASAGATGRLGDQSIEVRDGAARLADGRLAGSVATMDRVFRTLVNEVGLSLVDAAIVCSTTPSRVLGLRSTGALVRDALADFVVIDRKLEIVQTYIGGELAFTRPNTRT